MILDGAVAEVRFALPNSPVSPQMYWARVFALVLPSISRDAAITCRYPWTPGLPHPVYTAGVATLALGCTLRRHLLGV